MSTGERLREFGEGPLSRAAGTIYWFLIVGLLLALTCLPTFVAIPLLARDVSNIPLYALALVPLAPALAAAMFAWRVFATDRYPNPAKHFWRGYRLNVLDVLKSWVPTLLLLTILAMNVAHREAAGVPGALAVVFVVVGVGVVVWGCNMLTITSLFSFRVRDAARLAGYYIAVRPLVALGWLSLLVLAFGIVWITSDWVLGLVASPLTYFAWRNARPMVAEIAEQFVEPATP